MARPRPNPPRDKLTQPHGPKSCVNSSLGETTRLFHYALSADADLAAIVRPLSELRPDDTARLGFLRQLYDDWAAPLLGKPYPNSGVFLTPIDFRRLPGTLLYDRPRLVVPLDRIDPDWAVLTYEYDGQRCRHRVTDDSLADAEALWTEDLLRRWFGVDQTKLFYYVPQVVTYQPGGVDVQAED